MTAKLPASVGNWRFPDDVHYPDSDDEPLPDGRYQEPYFSEIVGTVREHFSDRPNVEVSGNTFIYYEEGNPRRFISPDLHVTLDVTAEGFASMDYRNTYLVWEIGKPADFVLEIASESTARRDVTEKRVLYAQIGFGEYWRFDGTGGDFYGEALVGEYLGADGQYHRFDIAHDHQGRPHGYSPTLGLWLYWEDNQLRFYDPATGIWLRTRSEERAGREAAEAAQQAAEAARQAAETRAAELEAELMRLRGESA
ncbi:MAG: Uma2 family endonuclease [Chloroflexota bacterium]|nr:Uma2 family endonuclease [Chloroflexota bacterium]MDE2959703.1 Uma2 family endonuclease [Chloroflexota bacterium]